jgi:hypothetical protein
MGVFAIQAKFDLKRHGQITHISGVLGVHPWCAWWVPRQATQRPYNHAKVPIYPSSSPPTNLTTPLGRPDTTAKLGVLPEYGGTERPHCLLASNEIL